jgi:hypothetical protein
MRKLFLGRLLPHRFGPGLLQRTFFERAVPPGRSVVARLDGTVRIKMESVQNANLVSFFLNIRLQQNGIRQKCEARRFLFYISRKSAKRAVRFRKRRPIKETWLRGRLRSSPKGIVRTARLFHRPPSSICSMVEREAAIT